MAARKPPAPTPRQPYSRAIPPHLHAAVMDRLKTIDPETGLTHGTRAVASWLAEAHGIRVHHATVARLRVALERHTEAQVVAALREELRETVAPTRAKLARSLRRLDELVRKSRDPKAVAAAVNATTRALHELATLGGVAAPVSVDLTTNGRAITLRWADEPADDHAPAAPPGAAGGGP